MKITVILEHYAVPDTEMTPERAHAVMQTHLNCLADVCPRKQQALTFLINTGRMVPPVDHPAEAMGGVLGGS